MNRNSSVNMPSSITSKNEMRTQTNQFSVTVEPLDVALEHNLDPTKISLTPKNTPPCASSDDSPFVLNLTPNNNHFTSSSTPVSNPPQYTAVQYDASDTRTMLIVEKLLDPQGKLMDVDNIPSFVRQAGKATSPEVKRKLLSILQQSAPIFSAFIIMDGLNLCNSWLSEASIILPVLKLLSVLPITLAHLEENGKIAKTVKQLKKSKTEEVVENATKLVSAWRALVTKNCKKRTLEGKKEPAKKKAAVVGASNAFNLTFNEPVAREITVVKKMSSAIENRNKITRKIQTKVAPKPGEMLTKKVETTTTSPPNTLRSSGGVVAYISANPFGNSNKPKKISEPLSSCFPRDMKQRKPRRALTWADDDKLVQVKKFPRDKSLSVKIPALRNRIQSPARQVKPVTPPAPVVPKMRPSTSWRAPQRILLPLAVKVGMGEASTEIKDQLIRERSIPKAFYPDPRRIPPSPSRSNEPNRRPLSDNDIRLIPLHDTSQPKTPVVPQQTYPAYPTHNIAYAQHSLPINMQQPHSYHQPISSLVPPHHQQPAPYYNFPPAAPNWNQNQYPPRQPPNYAHQQPYRQGGRY